MGFFCPLKTPQLTKKVADDYAKVCETYSTWSYKIVGDNIFDQGHPEVELLTKVFGRISRKWQSQYSLLLQIDRSVGRPRDAWVGAVTPR